MTEKIRKQVYHLTLEDLSRFPVWEFALDEEGEEGQDEATVRPYGVSGDLDASEGMFIVRAFFTLTDGSRLLGHLTPPAQGDTDLGVIQPTIVTKSGQINFWCGIVAPKPAHLTQYYEWLGNDAGRVFPIYFESEFDLVGGKITGTIPGFLLVEDLSTRRTKTLR
jgi:hypothetical protein